MKKTEAVRKCAAEQGIAEEVVLKKGLARPVHAGVRRVT
jgi:hypothetical protein